MRYAAAGSIALHLAVIGGALMAMGAVSVPDSAQIEAVAVDLVSLPSFSADTVSTVVAHAATAMQAAGSRAVVAVSPRQTELVETEAADATPTPDIEKPVEAQATKSTEPRALVTATAETAAPVPATPPARPAPEAQPPKKKPAAAPRQQAGNGGRDAADSRSSSASASASSRRATAGASGNAATSNYPGSVLRKLRGALRYPREAGRAQGEVHVQFTVAANGSASGIRVVRSSGNRALDQAAIGTVRRASPFPAIPGDAGRKSWTFTLPLAFRR